MYPPEIPTPPTPKPAAPTDIGPASHISTPSSPEVGVQFAGLSLDAMFVGKTSIRDAYEHVYGAEITAERFKQARMYAFIVSPDNEVMNVPSYLNPDKKVNTYSIPDAYNPVAVTSRAWLNYPAPSMDQFINATLKYSAGTTPSIAIHEQTHVAQPEAKSRQAYQLMGDMGVPPTGRLPTPEEKATWGTLTDADYKFIKYILGMDELGAHIAEFKAEYFIDTHINLLPNSEEGMYQDFVDWCETKDKALNYVGVSEYKIIAEFAKTKHKLYLRTIASGEDASIFKA